MQFRISTNVAFIAAIFMASVHGAPTNQTSVLFEKRTKDCGTSSFVDGTSGGSGTVSDCQKIVSNIANNGEWDYYPNAQRKLVSYGTCAFGVTGTLLHQIGNQDIIDIINSSVAKFSSGGKVGASGKVSCGAASVEWGLYHN